jgi:hypothetical protein
VAPFWSQPSGALGRVLEREQLSRSGRQDLADLVRWVARDPRIYVLEGAMDEAAQLEPSVFLALPL